MFAVLVVAEPSLDLVERAIAQDLRELAEVRLRLLVGRAG